MKIDCEKFIGLPFVDGARGPDSFDCFGIVKSVFGEYGQNIPDYVISCYNSAGVGKLIDKSKDRGGWKRIDEPIAPALITMAIDSNHQEYVNHVGVFVGDGYFIQTLNKTGVVRCRIDDPLFKWTIKGYYKWDQIAADEEVDNSNKISVTSVLNPFDVNESKEITYAEVGASLAEIAKPYRENDFGDKLCVSIDGKVIPFDKLALTFPKIGEVVVINPIIAGGGGAKDALRIVATILVIATAIFVPQVLLLEGFKALVVGAAIGVGGNLLINAVLPPPQAELPGIDNLLQQSQTYGWTPARNLNQEGIALPVIYGIHRVTPPIISSHISTEGDKQFLNVLYAVADGPIDNITLIEINQNPSSFYTDVILDTRFGDNVQTVLPFFQDTITEKAVGQTIDEDPAISTTVVTNGNLNEGLGVGLIFFQGLAFINPATGKYEDETVEFTVQFRPTSGGPLVDFPGSPVVLTDNRAETIRKFFRVDGIAPDEYDIVVKFTKAPTEGVEHINGLFWEYIQEIIPDDFTYPNTSLLSLRVLATDQLSGGAPVVTCLVTRNTVEVFTGVVDESLDANNPAWAAYDILRNDLYGANIPTDRIIFADFLKWADWCDSQNLFVNIYFDVAATLNEMLQRISVIGRASVIQRGTKFGAIVDLVDTPVQTFTVGNIIEDSFEETFIEKANRMNSLEITYFDSTLDFERRTIEVRDDDVDLDQSLIKKQQITFPGITNFDQASRQGKFLLNSNKFLIRTIVFKTDLDGVISQPGDVIRVQHFLPQWGFGGRAISSTNNTITLDQEVILEASIQYTVLIRRNADNVTEELLVVIVGTETTTDVLDLTSDWTINPVKDDLYSFGKQILNTKQFRIINIRRDQDSRCLIRALEYRPEVFDDSIAIPSFPVESDLPTVAGLVLTPLFRVRQDGTIDAIIAVSWRGFSVIWQIFLTQLGFSPVRRVGVVNSPGFEITGLDIGKTYGVNVSASDNPGEGLGDIITLVFIPPGAVTNLASEVIDNFILLRWKTLQGSLPIKTYEIRKGVDFATALVIGTADKTFTTVQETISGDFTYWVVAIDTAGVFGIEASITATVDQPADYELSQEITSNFENVAGRVNVVVADGVLYGPIDTSETFEDFFDNNGANTLQDFIDAGELFFFQPDGQSTGSYEETFDLGGLFDKISLRANLDWIVPTNNPANITVFPTISVSEDNVIFIDFPGQWTVSNQKLQFVKVKLDFARVNTNSIDILCASKLSINLSLRKVVDSGTDIITDADNGKVVAFTKPFLDIDSIQVTARSTTERKMVHDFVDIPNPTDFTAFMFDASGSKVTGTFTWHARGVSA